MYPYVTIFGYSIQTYHICAATAGIVGLLLSVISLRRVIKGAARLLLPLAVEIFAVVGARLLNFLTCPEAYSRGFKVFSLEYTKLSLMGGLILGLVPILLFCLFSRTDPRRVADAFCVPAAAGIMLLKLGCFLNGCCFGHPTTGPFGMVFPGNKAKYDFINSLPLLRATSPVVHPTQLYELFGALFAILIAFLLTRRSAPSGLRAALFAGLFATARLIVLPYRELPYSEFMIKVFYPALYVAVIFVCIVYVVIAVIRQ